jgi:hypothetical protein
MPIICLLLWLIPPQDPKPLPELKTFLAEARKKLHPDDVLLSEYTYSQKITDNAIGPDGRSGKSEVSIYDVTRDAKSGQMYRRLVSKNGSPVNSSKPEKVGQRRGRSRNDEDKTIDDVFAAFDFRIVGREDLGGRPAIRVEFKPRANYKPKTFTGRFFSHVQGEAWVNEEDHELVRMDAELIDNFSIGFGLLAKMQKGTHIYVERQKINDEIWLPAAAAVSVNARVLAIKVNRRITVDYSDYKKFNVDTIIKFPDADK